MEDALEQIRKHQEKMLNLRKQAAIDLNKICETLSDKKSPNRCPPFQGISDADRQHLQELIRGLKAQCKSSNLNLRWMNDRDGKKPVVKLGEFSGGELTLTVIGGKKEVKTTTDSWPELHVELAGIGQGSALTDEARSRGGTTAGGQKTAGEIKRMVQASIKARTR